MAFHPLLNVPTRLEDLQKTRVSDKILGTGESTPAAKKLLGGF
jgi:hypothetical protein